MKKALWVLLVVGLFLTIAAVSYACDDKCPGMGKNMAGQQGMGTGQTTMGPQGMMGKDEEGMKERGIMGHPMLCPLCSSRMKSIGNPQMVSTGDGGLVVLAGDKLTKYDKNLNVVKEVEIKVDVEAMMDKMKDCPVCKMMQGRMEEKKEMWKERRGEMKEQKREGK